MEEFTATSCTASPAPSNQDFATDLRDSLQSYKPVVPALYDFFTWKKQIYPIIIPSYVTFVFLIIHFLEVSLLTSLSITGAFIVLVDYFLPLLVSSLVDQSKWNDEDEQKFDEVCNKLAFYWTTSSAYIAHWHQMRLNKSKAYYAILFIVLLSLAWLGNNFNSLFLAYLVSLAVSLYPGLTYNGILTKYINKLKTLFKELVSKTKSQ